MGMRAAELRLCRLGLPWRVFRDGTCDGRDESLHLISCAADQADEETQWIGMRVQCGMVG